MGDARYVVMDPRSGLVEREVTRVFVGKTEAMPRPNRTEVDRIAAIPPDTLMLRGQRPQFSAWFWIVFRLAYPALQITEC